MNEDIVVTAVKDQKVAVYDLKRLVTPGQYLNEVVIYSIINTFVGLPNHRYIVSQYLSSDLKGDSKVLNKYEDEYKMYFDGYYLIVIPICHNAHWTLAIVYPNDREIEFYDSMHYRQQPNILFHSCKTFMEKVLGFDLSVIIREDLPHQKNLTDCGVYICKFAEHAISGITLNFDDKNMKEYRIEYANRIRLLKPDIPEYHNLRDVNEDEIIDDSNDEMTVFDNDEISECEDENERSTDDQQRLCKHFERSDLNNTNICGILLHEDSKDLETKTDKPFLGKDEFGKIITYNTKGDWTKMLYFVEILNYYDYKDHNHAFVLVINKILQNHSITHEWCQNSKNTSSEKLEALKVVEFNSVFFVHK